jgi:hypothetical protein
VKKISVRIENMLEPFFQPQKVLAALPANIRLDGKDLLEKTCFQNKSKFITEDQFVKHMNITIK